MSAALIWSPFADKESATTIARTLLHEGLVACVNIVPAVRSFYVWQGNLGEGREAGALFKTRADLLDAAVARLSALHPYQAPAIVGWHCDAAAPATLGWLGELASRR